MNEMKFKPVNPPEHSACDHDHGPGEHHSHSHGLGHHHHSSFKNLKIAFFLNASFTLIEFFGGLWTQSVAVMSDAVHDFGDCLTLAGALLLERWAAKRSSANFSYGYRRMSLLSALLTSVVLITGSIFVISSAIPRLLNPVKPHLEGMLALAVLGVGVNGYAAWKTRTGKTMNEQVVSWHLVEDTFGWVAVLITSIVMMFVDLPILDPILSIIFTGFILVAVLRSFLPITRLFLQGTPRGVNVSSLRGELLRIEKVTDAHDLHLWSLDGDTHVLTLHLVIASELAMVDAERIKSEARTIVSRYGKIHATIELETDAAACAVDCGAPH